MAPPGGNMDMAGMMGGPGSMMGGPLGFGPMMGDPSSMMMMGPMGFNQVKLEMFCFEFVIYYCY